MMLSKCAIKESFYLCLPSLHQQDCHYVTIYLGELYQLYAVSSVKSRAQQTNVAVSGSVGYKQVLDEVFVISRIINIKEGVIS